MNKLFAPVQAVLKAVASIRFGGSRWGWSSLSLGSTEYNYHHVMGTAPTNSAVVACVRWVCRTFPEAPLEVNTRDAEGELTPQLDHPLMALLERPNPYYSGLQLWTGTLADLLLTGNAYWAKVRGGTRQNGDPGTPMQLYWLPSSLIEPRWPDDGRTFIGWYDYSVDGQIQRLEVADVVQFRDGFDPRNMRKGLSALASLLREIATDDEAANYTASLLRNLGVPGLVLAPATPSGGSAEDLAETKAKIAQGFGGDNRGKTLVLGAPTSVSIIGFSPEQMATREARRMPEERISAVFGTPAVVVGLGAGLDRSTFSNMAEAREAAYESLIIPLQRLLLADLQQQLVPDFGDPAALRLDFDYSQVRVLQADHNALMERAVSGFVGGILSRSEARLLIGEEPGPADDVYQLAATASWVPSDEVPAPPEPAPVPVPVDQTPAALPAAASYLPLLKAAAPEPVRVTDAELELARERWRTVVPDGLADLLDATPKNGKVL